MVDISAAQVKALREKTDAPMLECKKALVEAGGDLEKAEDILRVRLGNKATKAASRVAAEGLLVSAFSQDGKQGVLLEVNCETDFVAKNDDFIAFANELARLLVEEGFADVEGLSSYVLSSGKTVEQTRMALVGKIGENISVRRFQRVSSENQLLAYVHNGRMAALVEYSGDKEVAKDVAMHVVAMKPVCLSREDVHPDVIEREKNIFRQQSLESGKPAEIVEKMVQGRINKFLAEVSLLEQPFVKDSSSTVSEVLKAKGVQVYQFLTLVLGEGIEKKQSSFAEEVAAVAARS